MTAIERVLVEKNFLSTVSCGATAHHKNGGLLLVKALDGTIYRIRINRGDCRTAGVKQLRNVLVDAINEHVNLDIKKGR